MKKKITIAASCLNESGLIRDFVNLVGNKIEKEFKDKYEYEILLADNNSSDDTQQIIRDICEKNKNVKAVFNQVDYGADRSVLNLMKYASGDAIIHVASDMQEDLEIIPRFIKKWESGEKYVVGQIISNQENFILSAIKNIYYKIYNKFSNTKIIKNTAGFLIDNKYNEIIKNISDPEPFARIVFSQVLGVPATVPVDKTERRKGKSKHNLFQYYSIAINSIAKSSSTPMKIITFVGFILSLFFFLISIYYFFMKLFYWDDFSLGLAPLIIILCLLSSFLLLSIGLIGEYIVAILAYNKNLPFIEKEKINFK